MEREERALWVRGPAGAKQGAWGLINNIWGCFLSTGPGLHSALSK